MSRALVLFGLGLLAFHNAFTGPFLFDDWANIVELKDLSALWPLEPFFETNRPLVRYSFAVNRTLTGLDVRSVHAVSIGLHLLNAVLLFAVIQSFLRQPRWSDMASPPAAQQMALLIAAIWVVHPLTTQSVTYMAQRYEVAMATGILGCLWTSLRSWNSARLFVWLFFSVVCCWVGFLSKEVAVVIPCVVPLVDRVATGTHWRQLVRQRWAFYAALWSPWLWYYPVFFQNAFSGRSMGFAYIKVSPWQYLTTQPEVIWYYLRLSVWPDQLCLDYWWPVQQHLWVSAVLGLPLAAIFLTGLMQACRGSLPGLLTTLFFFILAPTSSIVPIADLANEHRMYLPLICVIAGLVMFPGSLLATLARRFDITPTSQFIALGLTCTVLLAGLSYRTITRNEDYLSGQRIWSAAVRTNPLNSRAWYNVGTEYHDAGEFDRALAMYREGLKCPEKTELLYYGIGESLRRQGKLDEAEAAYRQLLALNRRQPQTRLSLGVLLQQRGDLKGALAEFEQAARAGLPEAVYNAASLKIELGRHQEAIRELQDLVQSRPDFKLGRRRLAWALSTAPQPEIRNGHAALKELGYFWPPTEATSPWVSDTYAAAYAAVGDFPAAVAAAERAMQSASEISDESTLIAMQSRLEGYRNEIPYVHTPITSSPRIEELP